MSPYLLGFIVPDLLVHPVRVVDLELELLVGPLVV